MSTDSEDFRFLLQDPVQIAVRSNLPDKLLGVRDGFRRFFDSAVQHPARVTIVPQPPHGDAVLPAQDEEILALARRHAHELLESHGDTYAFYVGTEAGLLSVACNGEVRHFVRTWTVVIGAGDEAWGSSGSIQLPVKLIEGLERDQMPFAIPGTRRRGGMVGSLTNGLESRRTATTLSTFQALCSLLFGVFDRRLLRS